MLSLPRAYFAPRTTYSKDRLTMANVNKPVDVSLKEADINRKLQLYGIIYAFQAGKVPSVCA